MENIETITQVGNELPSLIGSNKALRDNKVKLMVQTVQDGYLDATDTFIYSKKGLDYFTLLEKNLRPIVEGKGIPKGGIQRFDAEIIEKKSPNAYDFGVCGDSEYNQMIEELDALKRKVKDKESFLKTLQKPMATLDGEILNPPTILYGKLGCAVTLK